MRSLPRIAAFAGLGCSLGLAAGCGSERSSDQLAPKTITAAQVKEMPLEESGDLSIRQNLVDPSRKALVGRDTPVSNPPRKPKGQYQ